MLNGRMQSRVIYEDEHFVVVPAIGQFTEGGLLLLSRAHIPSFRGFLLSFMDIWSVWLP